MYKDLLFLSSASQYWTLIWNFYGIISQWISFLFSLLFPVIHSCSIYQVKKNIKTSFQLHCTMPRKICWVQLLNRNIKNTVLRLLNLLENNGCFAKFNMVLEPILYPFVLWGLDSYPTFNIWWIKFLHY